jgi:hypothetical protein
MNDTKIRVMAAILSIEEFTVAELCKRAGLRRAQVDPILAAFKVQGLLTASGLERREPQAARRPAGVYKLTGDLARRQKLANQLYLLRRALSGNQQDDSIATEAEAIQIQLEGLDLVLDICDRAAKAQPLLEEQLQRVERQVQGLYQRLESVTYKTGLDLRHSENQDHPLVRSWNTWHTCTQRLQKILDRWQGKSESFEAVSEFVSLPLPNRTGIHLLEVVTDHHFLDSAIFLWMFSHQPFRAAGFDIECRLVSKDWAEVSGYVASKRSAIGFYNRRVTETLNTGHPGYWTDLCIYRGYALLAHRDSGVASRPGTLREAEENLDRIIRQCRQDRVQPTVVSFGADTIWRFGDYLKRHPFQLEQIPDADAALAEFLRRPHTLFVGGLPQRLVAEKYGCVSILDATLDPTLFSMNGLIYGDGFEGSGKSILQAASALWFETCTRLKSDLDFRKRAATSISAMLKHQFGYDAIQHWMFDRLFDTDYPEYLAETPADIAARVKELTEEAVRHRIEIDQRKQASPGQPKVAQLVFTTLDSINEAFPSSTKRSLYTRRKRGRRH